MKGFMRKFFLSLIVFSCTILFGQSSKNKIYNPVGEAYNIKQEYVLPTRVDWKARMTDYEFLPIEFNWHVVALNQIGFEKDAPKRFTAPLSPDGTKFIVRKINNEKALFTGVIEKNIGDFSAFKPDDSNDDYVIVVSGGKLKTGASDPFFIKSDMFKKYFHQRAVDFLIDVRSVVGTHASAYGGGPWRDGWLETDFVTPSLIMFYLACQDEVLSMPHQIDYEAEKAKVMSPDFKYIPDNHAPAEFMDVVKAYFETIEPPAKDAPDVVKMIHWGVGLNIIIANKDIEKYSKQTKSLAQLAYFLWAYPKLEKWIPKSLYQKTCAVVFGNWYKSGTGVPWYWDTKYYSSLDEKDQKKLAPVHGGRAQGDLIVPNLMIYEVALRLNKPNAQIYMDAAVKQAQWMVDKFELQNPLATKGHRFYEYHTITNLVWFLKAYPQFAPQGLEKLVQDWAELMISRSNNMWDFRMLSPENNLWSVPVMNDVGNLLCFPSIAVAADWVVTDPVKNKRLKEIMYAQIDAIFGRNPRLCVGVSHPQNGWLEAERGWPLAYGDNICARLELCRASISTACGTEAYPFNPNGRYRHVEGWVMYGSVWLNSLAYLEFDKTKRYPWDSLKDL